jgi:hypothetical protein
VAPVVAGSNPVGHPKFPGGFAGALLTLATPERYSFDVGIGHRFGLCLLALAACAGSRPEGSLSRRPEHGPPPPDTPVDVTPAWDSQPAAMDPPAEGPLVSLEARWGAKGKLPLRELDAQVVVEGPLAFTELRLVFENTSDHLIEVNPKKLVVPSYARLDLRLPRGGALARYAVEHTDGWTEAEMAAVSRDHPCVNGFHPFKETLPEVTDEVPRHSARFGANIEPIKPHSRQTVRVAFTQPLVSPGEPYRLPLRGLEPLERLQAVVRFPFASPPTGLSVHKETWTPDRDWVVDLPSSQPSAMRSGRFAIARIARPAEAATPEPLSRVAFLLDTSASRGEGVHADAMLLADLLTDLAATEPNATVSVAAFDQDVEPVYAGPPAGFGASELARVDARGALGATDLGPALSWAAQQHVGRIVLLSDGVATLGRRTVPDLAPDLDALRTAGVKRLDTTSSPDESGEAFLTTLASRLEKPGVVFGRQDSTAAFLARLSHAAMEPVEVPGALWSWPREARAGTPVLVFAELPPEQAFEVRISGKTVPVDARKVTSPLVAHEAARADVERLQGLLPAARWRQADPARAPLAELSTEYRVLSEEGRWVIPASEDEYARFGLDRTKSLILSAGPSGVTAAPREPLHSLPTEPSECSPPPVHQPDTGWNDLVARVTRMPVRVILETGPEGLSSRKLAALRDNWSRVMFDRNPAPGSLEVEGYCNESAVEAVNMRISRARARALRDELRRDEKLKMWNVEARGYGSVRPLVGYYEYAWGDGWGPSSRKPGGGERSGLVGPSKPALGDHPKGEVALRIVIKEPPKTATSAGAPFSGQLEDILSDPDKQHARDSAEAWHRQAPSDLVAALAVGRTRQALGDISRAARAFGSLLDLAPRSASACRSAAAFLEGGDPALSLKMLEEAPAMEADQAMMSRWALGLVLARAGKLDEAADKLASTLEAWEGRRSLDNGDMRDFRELERIFFTSPSTHDVLEQELSVVAAAAARAHPEKKASLEARLHPFGVGLATRPSLRFVLTWESSVDLDLQVESGKSGWDPRASIDRDALPGEGIVLADVRAFGPEAYVVNGAERAFPYRVLAHLHGPAGNTLGRLDILDYDGAGHLGIEGHPFMIQTEGGTAEVDTLRGPLMPHR